MKGEERADTRRGPRKERGTTPGNSTWSYCKNKDGWREGRRKGGCEGGREGSREGGREGGR